MFDEIKWLGSGPPIAEPRCGFRGEKCISEYKFHFSGITKKKNKIVKRACYVWLAFYSSRAGLFTI